jgi:hypothetical protein
MPYIKEKFIYKDISGKEYEKDIIIGTKKEIFYYLYASDFRHKKLEDSYKYIDQDKFFDNSEYTLDLLKDEFDGFNPFIQVMCCVKDKPTRCCYLIKAAGYGITDNKIESIFVKITDGITIEQEAYTQGWYDALDNIKDIEIKNNEVKCLNTKIHWITSLTKRGI